MSTRSTIYCDDNDPGLHVFSDYATHWHAGLSDDAQNVFIAYEYGTYEYRLLLELPKTRALAMAKALVQKLEGGAA